MNVKEVMVAEVKCCGPNETLNPAAQIMWENDCGCVPVVDGGSRVIGMLTDRDICMAAYTQGTGLSSMPVSSVMSRDVLSCRPSDDLLAAQRVMRERQVRRLPVVDANGKLLGILSLNDIARAVAHSSGGKTQVASTLVAICAPHQRKAQSNALQNHRRERSRPGSRRSEGSAEGAPRQ